MTFRYAYSKTFASRPDALDFADSLRITGVAIRVEDCTVYWIHI